MEISKEQFFKTGEESGISSAQLNTFWNRLDQVPEVSAFAKTLYYLGAMIIIGAMTWLMSTVWDFFGGAGMFIMATAYALLFFILGRNLWNNELKIPGGLLITCAVCMVPLAIYGLEVYFDLIQPDQAIYRWVSGRWIFMELGTILAASIALYLYPFPFMTIPLLIALWFLSMDISSLIWGDEINAWVSLFFGLAVLVWGFFTDLKKKEDFAFWIYLFGTLSFWGGLNALVWDMGNLVLFGYLFINFAMMILSVFVRRKVLMIFGAIGVYAYLSYLAFDLFADSILLPFVLIAIGLSLVFVGIWYQKNQDALEERLRKLFSKEDA